MKKTMYYMVCALAVSLVINNLEAAPRWSATVPQIGDAEVKQTLTGGFNREKTCVPGVWSGTKDDLSLVVAKAKEKYGFEDSKHLGRNATMPVPATWKEMVLERSRGNPNGWKEEGLSYFHQPGTTTIFGPNIKYTNPQGSEVVYNKKTGRIVSDEYMGTKNIISDYENNKLDHTKYDIVPHLQDSGYKYVGILYETDPTDPNRFYIVDGQTGKRMTQQQVEDFPTTLSDMWKEKGVMCVAEDGNDLVINTSKLEALLKRMIVFAQSLLDAGEKATEDQISTYNSYADEAMRELVRLLRPILALPASDADKQKIFKEKIEAKLKVLIERHQVLQKQLVSRGLVGGLRPVSLDGLDNAEFGRSAKGEDSCSCGDPVPYVNAKMGSIPQTVMCEKCGRVVGVETNGRIISNNPAANGKAAKLSSGKGK